MFLILTVVGAAGAGLLYAINPFPALGARAKNAAGILVAALVGVALSQAGVAAAWTLPEAWCTAFLVLWASNFQVGPDDLVWVRAVTSVGFVALLSQFFR